MPTVGLHTLHYARSPFYCTVRTVYGLYCPQDRAGTDVQTHINATKAPLTGNGTYLNTARDAPATAEGVSQHQWQDLCSARNLGARAGRLLREED
jgi:hypothetical protein